MRDEQTVHVKDMCLLLDEEIHYIYAKSGFERSRSYGSSTVSQRKLDTRKRPTKPWSALTGSIYNHSSTKNLEFCYQLAFPGRQQKISSAESILKKVLYLSISSQFYFSSFWLQRLMKIIFRQILSLRPSDVS